DIRWKPLDNLDNQPTLARRHAGRGLVEQQHLRRQTERDGDLNEPLAAIGERADRAQRIVRETERLEQCEGLLDDAVMTAGRADQTAGDAVALGDRERHVFKCCQAAEQRRDLERAGKATLDAHSLRQIGDIGAVDDDLAGARPQAAGDKLDKGRLAGTVWADQRLARAAFQAEVDLVGDGQRAKALAQAPSFEREPVRRGWGFDGCRLDGWRFDRSGFDGHRRSRSERPRMPPRANTTTSTISSPIQKYQ